MRYTDELEPLLEVEGRLRRQIAQRVAEEAGVSVAGNPSDEQMAVADEAIHAWLEDGELQQDMRAFRPVGPLQQLLIDHRQVADRIADIRDQRLS